MKRRILSLALLCVSLLCMAAQYPKSIGGITQGETCSYNKNTGVLVLNNYNGPAFYDMTTNNEMVDECTIRIEGKCVIKQDVFSQRPAILMTSVRHLKIIFAEGASLELYSESVLLDYATTCICAQNSDIDISCEGSTGTLSLMSAPNGKLYGMGINAKYGTVTIKNNVNVDIKVETLIEKTEGQYPSCGIDADSLCVDDKASLSIDISGVKGKGYAFYTDDYTNGSNRNYTNSQKIYLGRVSEVKFKLQNGIGQVTKEEAFGINNEYEYCHVTENSCSSDNKIRTLRYEAYQNVVSSVSINVPEPKLNESIPTGAYWGAISDDVGYSSNNVYYEVFEDGAWTRCNSGSVFEIGKEYRLRGSVYPAPSAQVSAFAKNIDDMNVTVNGNKCDNIYFGISNPRGSLNFLYKFSGIKDEAYLLCLADQMVRTSNCSDLSVIPGVEGTVKYDPTTNTLTLRNATITNTAPNTSYNNNGGYGILNKIDGLTIKIEGENTITSTQWDGLASVGNLTITGNGTLNIDAKGTALGMIGATSYYLTINGGAKIFAKGMYGVYGGMKTVPAAGGQLTESYVTHLRVSGAKTELHVYGTEQCAQLIAFLETDAGMEMRGESGKAYFEQNSFCYFERHRYQPYVNQWVTIKYPDGFILGDVNHDGSITMADANAVVNYFLATDKPEDFDKTIADVNGDGSITMADANMIVNMFLGQ